MFILERNNYIFLFLLTILFCINFCKSSNTTSFETFLKNSLNQFKARNFNYPVGPDGLSIIYNFTKDLNYQQQFSNDIVMIFKTLYPENNSGEFFLNKITADKPSDLIDILNQQILLAFKKIIMTIVQNRVYYDKRENFIINFKNLSESNQWPHPFASLLCHGGRILFLQKKNSSLELKNYLFGNNTYLLKPRSTSSHKVEYDKQTNNIYERKIFWEAFMDWVKTVLNLDSSHHYGMNIPLGGVGNYWPDGESKIIPMGYGMKGIDVKHKDPLQSGHLFVRLDDLEDSEYSSVLIGLEEEAPNYRGMFSTKVHDFLNALQPPATSVCGGAKWGRLSEVLGDKVPHNIGGRVVYVGENLNDPILNKIENLKIDLAKKVWWIILSSNMSQYIEFEKILLQYSEKDLENYLNKF
jgi:hypothetical protein